MRNLIEHFESFLEELRIEGAAKNVSEVFVRIDTMSASDANDVDFDIWLRVTAAITRSKKFDYILELSDFTGQEIFAGDDKTDEGRIAANLKVAQLKKVCESLNIQVRSGRIEF